MHKKLHNVLVLSRAYFPVSIMSWQNAMGLLMTLDRDESGECYAEKAAPLDNDLIAWNIREWLTMPDPMKDNYACVRTPKLRIALPEILVLKVWNRLPDRFVTYSRESVLQRDGLKCGYCGAHGTVKTLTIDHIIPTSKGGKNTWNNVVAACRACNAFKDDRTPEQAGLTLLVKPRKPSWLSMLGKKTAIGKVPESWKRFLEHTESTPNSL